MICNVLNYLSPNHCFTFSSFPYGSLVFLIIGYRENNYVITRNSKELLNTLLNQLEPNPKITTRIPLNIVERYKFVFTNKCMLWKNVIYNITSIWSFWIYRTFNQHSVFWYNQPFEPTENKMLFCTESVFYLYNISIHFILALYFIEINLAYNESDV